MIALQNSSGLTELSIIETFYILLSNSSNTYTDVRSIGNYKPSSYLKMLNAIKRFFDINLAPGSPQKHYDPDHAIRMAVAALLVEVAESDYHHTAPERAVLLQVIHNHFGLDAKRAIALVKLAEAEHADATDYFQFTNLINRHYNPQQKIQVIEELWRVAYADKKLDKIEEHVIRRLADLIHVSHKDFIATKHRIAKST